MAPRRSNGAAVAVVLAIGSLVLSGLIAGCSSGEDTFHGILREQPLEVGAISLPDVTGQGLRAGGQVVDGRLVMAADDGRLLLVTFGFLNCPDICPTTLMDIRAAIERVDPPLRERIDVAFVTVDPDRDGPEELAAYLRHFFPSHHAVRGEERELVTALDAFLASAEVVVDADGRVEVAHTAIVYAIDAGGQVRIEWPYGTSPDAMAGDLTTLVAMLDAADVDTRG